MIYIGSRPIMVGKNSEINYNNFDNKKNNKEVNSKKKKNKYQGGKLNNIDNLIRMNISCELP